MLPSSANTSESALRKDLCDAGRVLYERGLIGPTDGNFSARVGDRYLVCTPSGAHKGELRPEDLVKLTLDGRVVTPGGKPSSELRMHIAIYRLRPDVRCIVHAHPPCAVGLTVAGVSLEQPVVPEIIFALGLVPNVPYSSPTTDEVPEAIRPVLARTNSFMMARHGSVVLCDNPRDGVMKTEIIEHTAKITLAARVAGSASPLPAAEVDKLLDLANAARMSAGAESSAGGRAVDGRIVPTPGAAQRTTAESDDEAVVDAITRAVLARLGR
jgi:L-fuculose-phosphate aldolase